MKIIVFTEEKGLHNPYSLNEHEQVRMYHIASFVIDCIKKAEELFAVSPKEIFSRSKDVPVPSVRGALMLCMYEELLKITPTTSMKMVASTFGRDHSTLLHFSRLKKNEDVFFLRIYKELSLHCQQLLIENPLFKDHHPFPDDEKKRLV